MSQPRIPILDLAPEIELLWEDLNAAFQRVLRSGQFIGGPEVDAFEQEVAAYLGTTHAVGVNSGTDALVIGLRTLSIGSGDEVITTPFSFFATAESISNVGATPVFVDIDERTFNINPALIEAAITPRTKAIMPVHLYGRPCEMDAIMGIAQRHDLKVIEDCAQSFGARFQGTHTGTIGHVGAFSFFPSKNLGGFGDGGMLVTDDADVALLARKLRAHGSSKKSENEMPGYKSRLDALQAALLRVKLPYVNEWNDARRRVALTYNAALEGVPGLETPGVVDGHVFHQYTIRHRERDVLRARMADAGIGTVTYYPLPQDQMPVLRRGSVCPASARAAGEVLSLPIGSSMDDATLAQVAREILSH